MHHVALAALLLFAIILFAVSRGDTPRRRITLSVGDAEGSLRPAKARRLARELLEKADEAEDE